MSSVFRPANDLLHELGVASPQDIDIEAIAYYCGAEVRYDQLDGCAARLIGAGDRAIITIDAKSPKSRQRFSIAHELGHWMRDRGKTAYICTKGDVRASLPDATMNPETGANRYAADLLMPDFIFKSAAKGRPMTMDQVRQLSDLFQTSLSATAIRFVQYGPAPAMLVFHKKQGKMKFVRGPDVPSEIWPHQELSHNTSAIEVLYGKMQQAPRDIDADEWINHRDAGNYSVTESSAKIADDCVMSLIWWKNERQLTDLEE